MKQGDRIYLENEDLHAALASGMVAPHGVDSLGKTVYLLTRAGEILTGAGHLNVGSTAQKIQRSHPLLLGRPGPLGLA